MAGPHRDLYLVFLCLAFLVSFSPGAGLRAMDAGGSRYRGAASTGRDATPGGRDGRRGPDGTAAGNTRSGESDLPGGQGGSMAGVIKAVVLAGVIGAAMVVAGVSAVVLFMMFRHASIPAEALHFPIMFQYPPKHTDSLGGERGTSMDVVDGSATPPPTVADAGPAPARGVDTSIACAEVHTTDLPPAFVDLQVDIAATFAPGFSTSMLHQAALEPIVSSFELLRADGSEILSLSQPVWIPEEHWLLRFLHTVIWGPPIVLGLCRNSNNDFIAPVLDHVKLQPSQLQDIRLARICMQPPMPAFHSTLILGLRLYGPLRAVQSNPVAICIVLAAISSTAAGLMLGCCALAIYAGA